MQDFLELLYHLFQTMYIKLYKVKDAIIGSLVYSVYAHFFLKKEWIKNVIEFFIGVIVCIYATPVMSSFFPTVNLNFLSFVIGLSAMKFVEILLLTNWRMLLELFIKTKIDNLKNNK